MANDAYWAVRHATDLTGEDARELAEQLAQESKTADWIPYPHAIKRELEHPHEHAYYTPAVEWPTLDEKLANPKMLLRLAKHVC